MELIDRYLQAVKLWLPGRQKQDIVAELRDDLQSQIEEREAEFGRPLSEGEVAELLERCGRPMAVAGRYLPQKPLIGPALFPVYRMALKAAALLYLVPWVAGWIAFAIFVPSFRESTPGLTLLKGWATFWEIALFAFGAITVVFVAIEHWPSSTKPSFRWDPRRLPPVRDTQRIPRASSIAELLLLPLMASWWLDAAGGAPIAWTVAFHPFRWSPGSVWTDFHARFYWPLLAVWGTIFVTAAVNLVRPYWTRTRLAVRAAGSALTALMITAVLLPHRERVAAELARLKGLRGAKDAPGVAEAITDVAVFWVLAVTALALVCQLAWDAYRFWQCRPGADGSRVSQPPLPGRLPNH
jgi:hypothetical protein